MWAARSVDLDFLAILLGAGDHRDSALDTGNGDATRVQSPESAYVDSN